jgi:selenocysteine lyase/cysteine desulfurase
MYAPFGTGAIVGRRDIFERGDPDMTGGGTVEIVTLEDVVWAGTPDRDEAGSPNTIGAIALASAIRQFEKVGMQAVADHEAALTSRILEGLTAVPGVRIFGDTDSSRSLQRLGVVPFQLDSQSHFLVAAILGHEFGIGVRSGCFCAHPYILHLLRLTQEEAGAVRRRMLAGDRSEMPGMLRASFGLYNTSAEVDALIEALFHIARGEYQGEYIQERATGEYRPIGWQPHYEQYFSL